MLGILTFILVFGIIVVVHEFGHFYFAKKSGILVREFAIGMGPKIFAHIGKDGTAYTIRILPLGGYVRMAGWGDDTTEIKTGTPVSLTLADDGKVKRINLSGKKLDQTALPMQVTQFDFEDKLFIKGLVLEEEKTFAVDHDATVVEADGTEVRIAPLDVQYQNATIWGKLITNFAGPMNNFILGVVVFWVLIFMQGGVRDVDTNQFHIMPQGALAKVGVPEMAQITKIGSHEVSNWESLIQAVETETKDKTAPTLDVTISEKGSDKQVTVTPKDSQGRYLLGVQPGVKSDFLSMFVGGFTTAADSALRILSALKNLIFQPDLNKLGGPVAIFKASSDAAKNGIENILYFLAMISINIGIFNLIPIPALDGGKIVLNILEAIRRKPLKQEIETYVTLAGVVIMVVLMIAVTWNDIMRLFFR
ncbi:TPA: RIP metalloprotease RseP [Streptococcus pneumoniae]|jgi:site-2 protease. Metallo peptidase. MEROPS family M50B|uniref:Putative zinc metalloprotease SP_0263 n=2 Tax=Streptococcus pneumoniae TaxID=1313 RepID=Y263_STRPN|nr:RIP metalloprotease RseP [Streptococcus pneumoniae]Q97SR2.1 RecName: Full=Putative zinc metalloprotease SP_0263 [Streptococcus pneumoniae TIGR4]EHD83029.1 RIP metalloprotease RseP [Streptococcus pneumoniae GA07643]EJG71734.1 RIP metalloprotease RseP [Streptococcus pneumoniae 2081074]EJG76138.1 RIP metalloprotease RseP [Streptococcus pneumoniae 2082170]EJG81467.1 RIP metalloprotease RseP [Streptococcus pneumoniae SPAR48]AAK74441.1 eep protein [Streptococcus pneumoniae TIGR4]